MMKTAHQEGHTFPQNNKGVDMCVSYHMSKESATPTVAGAQTIVLTTTAKLLVSCEVWTRLWHLRFRHAEQSGLPAHKATKTSPGCCMRPMVNWPDPKPANVRITIPVLRQLCCTPSCHGGVPTGVQAAPCCTKVQQPDRSL
jgi:hypothetical protein